MSSMANTSLDCEKQGPGSTTEHHTAANDPCFPVPDESRGASSSSNPSTGPSPSPFDYYSTRIQSMIENRSRFSSELEFEIESSKVHWSELADITSETEQYRGEMNRKYYEELKLRQQEYEREMFKLNPSAFKTRVGFFNEKVDWVVGEKIGEGAQAEIYEAGQQFVLKVFPEGFDLRDLEKQWPQGMVIQKVFHTRVLYLLRGVTLLKDQRFLNRFAVIMLRQWGDLRKLIDLQMVERNNQGPPFTVNQVKWLMYCIALDMSRLHAIQPPILHRDLKPANVLLRGDGLPSLNGSYSACVADYECSVGVMGTGFYRAPEILQQLNNRVPGSPLDLKFTKKCDVYSFGMLCYELVTGRIPFEGHPQRDFGLVLDGYRPELPPDLDPMVQKIIESCWHPNPAQRPRFDDIVKKNWWPPNWKYSF